ncbi:MAG: hypothetical protein HYV09_06940 [Deltaproteobacteria bacterium]|nr:hypothetical protein [Deltaproteobacteria bacterium]
MINRNRSIASWMASVVVGTYVGAWGFATLSALLRGGLLKWAFLMAVCSVLAAVQVVLLGAIDVVLLWLRLRMLPQGRNAWLGSIGSMAAVLAIGLRSPFAGWHTTLVTPSWLVFSLVLPMLFVPLGVRLFFGERCD